MEIERPKFPFKSKVVASLIKIQSASPFFNLKDDTINTKKLKNSAISPKNFHIDNGMSFSFVKTGYRGFVGNTKTEISKCPFL